MNWSCTNIFSCKSFSAEHANISIKKHQETNFDILSSLSECDIPHFESGSTLKPPYLDLPKFIRIRSYVVRSRTREIDQSIFILRTMTSNAYLFTLIYCNIQNKALKIRGNMVMIGLFQLKASGWYGWSDTIWGHITSDPVNKQSFQNVLKLFYIISVVVICSKQSAKSNLFKNVHTLFNTWLLGKKVMEHKLLVINCIVTEMTFI